MTTTVPRQLSTSQQMPEQRGFKTISKSITTVNPNPKMVDQLPVKLPSGPDHDHFERLLVDLFGLTDWVKSTYLAPII
ncbi:hypothetical protein ACLUWT_09410 [Limosilactobacillus mucosae]